MDRFGLFSAFSGKRGLRHDLTESWLREADRFPGPGDISQWAYAPPSGRTRIRRAHRRMSAGLPAGDAPGGGAEPLWVGCVGRINRNYLGRTEYPRHRVGRLVQPWRLRVLSARGTGVSPVDDWRDASTWWLQVAPFQSNSVPTPVTPSSIGSGPFSGTFLFAVPDQPHTLFPLFGPVLGRKRSILRYAE
jgi:hypothetical protein